MVVIQTHADRAHSWFSPSAASRILRCPGSVRACEGLPDAGGDAADDGTLCHEYMEAYFKGEDTSALVGKMQSTKYNQKEAVEEASRQVGEYMEGLMMVHGEDVDIKLEVKSFLPDDMSVFGTVDMVMWFPATSHLVVLDYKFGIGEVSPFDNDQLRTYGSMLVGSYPDAKTIELAVCQPRTDKQVKAHTYTRTILDIWKQNVLMPGIAAAQDPNAPLIPGAEQCKWCRRGRYGCEVAVNQFIGMLGSENVENPVPVKDKEAVAARVFPFTAEVNNAELKKLADALPWLKIMLSHIEEAIVNRMMGGEDIDGYKLVNAVTRRKWLDEEKASSYLQRRGLKEADRYEKKLINPTKAEKLIEFSQMEPRSQTAFRKLVHFPIGKPTFAPVNDPRPPYKEAEDTISVDVVSEDVVEEKPVPTPQATIDLSSLF